MEDTTVKNLISDMLSNIVSGDKPEEEKATSTGLMSSLPGTRTSVEAQQEEQDAKPKARDRIKEFILRLSEEAEDTNNIRYSEKDAPEITDVMVNSETLHNRYDTPLYVYARNLRDYSPERSTIKIRNRGDHSENFLDRMEELARQSAEEAALERMEMGITKSLPRSLPQMGFNVLDLIEAVKKDKALIDEPEELDNEEATTLSDTDTDIDLDTDNADGGAAPSDGKVDEGLMSPRLDKEDNILPPTSVFVKSAGSAAGDAERKIYRDAYQAGLSDDELKAFMAQVAHESLRFGRLEEYGYLKTKVNGSWVERTPAQIATKLGGSAARKAAFNALANNTAFTAGTDAQKNNMIFDIYYDDQYRSADAKVGNSKAGDGSKYKGRGYIQLTGRDNYKTIGADIGEDLVGNPDLMLDPAIARKASIAWWKRNVRGSVPNDDYTDIEAVSGLVNRGSATRTASGLTDRRKMFAVYNTPTLRPRARPEQKEEVKVASN